MATSTDITDLSDYRAQIDNLLQTGNKLYTEYNNDGVLKEVLSRKEQLKNEEKTLNEEIKKGAAIIEKNNQDFYDVKQTLPEIYNANNKLHTIEDYTLGFLSVSYLFMVTMLIYLYVMFAENRWAAFGRSSLMTLLVTLFLALLLYYFG